MDSTSLLAAAPKKGRYGGPDKSNKHAPSAKKTGPTDHPNQNNAAGLAPTTTGTEGKPDASPPLSKRYKTRKKEGVHS